LGCRSAENVRPIIPELEDARAAEAGVNAAEPLSTGKSALTSIDGLPDKKCARSSRRVPQARHLPQQEKPEEQQHDRPKTNGHRNAKVLRHNSGLYRANWLHALKAQQHVHAQHAATQMVR